jgi:hypothetical protein
VTLRPDRASQAHIRGAGQFGIKIARKTGKSPACHGMGRSNFANSTSGMPVTAGVPFILPSYSGLFLLL